MVFFVIGIAMGIGAMLGVFTSIEDGVGLMLVMGIIGAVFAGAIAGGLCAMVQALRRRTFESDWQDRFAGSPLVDDAGIHSAQLMEMAKKWSDEVEHSPIVGNVDHVSKSISGWRHSADITRSRDIL